MQTVCVPVTVRNQTAPFDFLTMTSGKCKGLHAATDSKLCGTNG